MRLRSMMLAPVGLICRTDPAPQGVAQTGAALRRGVVPGAVA
jgi:hypothetical protein